jgi:hypothetical protein
MPFDLIAVEDWNMTTGCALDDSANPTQMLSIRLKFAAGAAAATATVAFQGERGGPGVGSLTDGDLNVQPDPVEFSNYYRLLTSDRAIGANIALDDKNQLLSFSLAFNDGNVDPA